MSPSRERFPAALAAPLASLYEAVVRRRNRRFDRPGAALRAPLPVVSVGNVTVGGTGKTPAVAMLCRRLAAAGARPAVVTRGYGGTVGRGPAAIPPDADRPDPGRYGDEPSLLARTLPGTLVVVGSDRVAGAREAAARGATVVVLDDGFQHRRLARDVDVVLIDATDPFGGGRVLPAGRLREPLCGLARADVVVVTRSGPEHPFEPVADAVRRHHPGVDILRSSQRAAGFVDRSGRAVATPAAAVAFCGIGNPASFERELRAAGIEILRFAAFRDHRPYRRGDLEPLVERARRAGVALVTTEKDLVRLERRDAPDPGPLAALRIETVLEDDAPLVARLRRAGAMP